MSRSPRSAAFAVLVVMGLAVGLNGCQATSTFFSGEETDPDATSEGDASILSDDPNATAGLPAYQPPVYQQPVYQAPGQFPPGSFPPGQVPVYQQPGAPIPYPGQYQGQYQGPYQGAAGGVPAYRLPGAPPPPYSVGGPSPYVPGYPPRPPLDPALIERGEYLVQIGSCTECHSDGALEGKPEPNRYLAGSHIGINVEGLGVMYPPNITPDRETGLGYWSIEDISYALRTGMRPDGSTIRPPMPIANISRLTPEDATAVAVYLKSIRPIHHVTNRNPIAKSRANYPYLGKVNPMLRERISAAPEKEEESGN